MPAPKLFIGPKEIANLMCISIREAQYTMKMFELAGRTVKFGRLQRVSIKAFADYISAQDGSNAADTLQLLKQALKGA